MELRPSTVLWVPWETASALKTAIRVALTAYPCLGLPADRSQISVRTLQNLGAAGVVEKFSSTVTQFDDVLIYTHGRHIIKAGFQTNRYNINVFYTGNGGELGVELFGAGPGGTYSGIGAAG